MLSPARLRVQVGAITLTRTVTNTSHRMIYPFLPTIARGLGVDLEAVALIVTARSGLGLGSPLFGSLADRHGRKLAMLLAMLAFTVGMVLVSIWPTYPALFAGLLLTMIAKLVFDPAMQAYIGDRVQYAQRGRALAIAEMSWSSAFLLGVPLAGWLIARTDRWYAPFPWLAGLGVLFAAALWIILPSDAPQPGERPALVRSLQAVLEHPAALAGLVIGLLISASNETVNIVFGVWMEDAFGLKVAALGAASAVIGIAELGGEGLVAGLADRLGKRRAVMLGIVLNALACLGLPALGFSVEGALVGLFVFFITFEFLLVSTLPLMSELVPGARATLMAGYAAALAGGRMVGALLGPALFEVGLLANGAAAALLNVIALLLLIRFVRQA